MNRFVAVGVLVFVLLLASSAYAVTNRNFDPSGYSHSMSLTDLGMPRMVRDEGFFVIEKVGDNSVITIGSVDYCCDDADAHRECSAFVLKSSPSLGGALGLFSFQCSNHRESQAKFSAAFRGYILEKCGIPIRLEPDIEFTTGATATGKDYSVSFRTPTTNRTCLTLELSNIQEESCVQYAGFCYVDVDVDGKGDEIAAHTITIPKDMLNFLLSNAGVGPGTAGPRGTGLSPTGGRQTTEFDRFMGGTGAGTPGQVTPGAAGTMDLVFNEASINAIKEWLGAADPPRPTTFSEIYSFASDHLKIYNSADTARTMLTPTVQRRTSATARNTHDGWRLVFTGVSPGNWVVVVSVPGGGERQTIINVTQANIEGTTAVVGQ